LNLRSTSWGAWAGGLLLTFAAALTSTEPVWADSELMLPYPTHFGKIPAATFDAGRQRVGDANLEIEKLEDGTIGTMRIDHTTGEASCSRPHSDGQGMRTQQVPLPSHDRIANVPLNLLFDPLVKGDALTVDFQILICRDNAKLVNFQARVVHREEVADDSDRLVEVRYGPDLGSVFSLLARTVVPRLSFWFDPASSSPWIAHRMPLYADGPEVFVVRQGIETNTLLD
jgi:hypothetical protein